MAPKASSTVESAPTNQAVHATSGRQSFPLRPLLPVNPAVIPADAPPAEHLPLCLQCKVAIGASDDPMEAAADRTAEEVMRMDEPANVVKPAAPPQLRRVAAPGSNTGMCNAPLIVHEVLRAPGRPLDREARDFMEPRFGRDLSTVRIHTDGHAALSARAINARAYTSGNRIVWGEGAYAPDTPAGKRLLAHELAHVVQQGIAPQHPSVTLVQREEVDSTPPADLGWLSEALVGALSAPALALGETAHGLVHSTWHGFVAEIKSGFSEAASKVMGRLKEFATSPSELLSFFPKYWWGLLKGIVSPITGLFDLVKFGIILEGLSEKVLATAWSRREQLAADAKGLAGTMRSMGGKAKSALSGMLSHPIDTVAALGPLLENAKQDANLAAEKGGHKIGAMLLESADKPIPDLAETAGEVIGTVVVNVALFVFTDGIGDAIVQVAGKLGETAAVLSKLGKGAEMLGGLVTKLAELLSGIGGWVTKAEEFITSVASAVLKPLQPVLEELGEAMSGLRKFLRDLLGVAEQAEGQEAAAASKTLADATRERTPTKLPGAGDSHTTPPTKVPASKAPTKSPKPRYTAHAGGEGDAFSVDYRPETVPHDVSYGRVSGKPVASSTDDLVDETAGELKTPAVRDEDLLATQADEIDDPMVDPEDRAMQLGSSEPERPANAREAGEMADDRAQAQLTPRDEWSAPPGSAPRPPDSAPTADRLEWLHKRLQTHVDQAIERYAQEVGLTPGQEAALLDNPNLLSAFRGSRIDQLAKDTIMQDADLADVITAPDFFAEPDILSASLPEWFDITTRAAWMNHLIKYQGRYGSRAVLLPTQ
jgi:hypothetical protein